MSIALYRRYRPESFADVIGQDHVTAPLRQALRTQRVHHAYLFSGPRGCGKTTSARILARCLNCAGPDGTATEPTDTPCGVCNSCVELARGGSGSLDVVEIDAASHGGVDDARELRERATFAAARDRYKIFVIDEAHMVTPQGFNALLKIVEEPPEHVKFVFATTEPEKVIGTIRSRTHHYPFHLVPPEILQSYLEKLCESEGVSVGKGVLPLVVRAGAGSVRDSLSVLDQLIAGADDEGLDYPQAIALLGYTDAALLDDVVDAFAAGDGATVFKVVDRVIGSGHDPRRFVEDLLERLRDLIIVQAVGEGARSVLRGLPDDQLERIRGQAARFGAGEVSRAADVANDALTEMTGATSPRLHLELLCARILLPGSEAGERGMVALLDRLERRLGVPVEGSAVPLPVVRPADPEPKAPEPVPEPQPSPAPVSEPAPDDVPAPVAEPAPEPVATGGKPADVGSDATEAVRRLWPDVLSTLAGIKRSTWTLVSDNAQVLDCDGSTLRLAFTTEGRAQAFSSGAHAELLREALVAVLGLDVKVVGVAAQTERAPSESAGRPAPAAETEPATPEPATPKPDLAPAPEPRPEPGRREPEPRRVAPEHDVPSADDPDAEDSDQVGTQVVERLLGGRVIDDGPPR